MKGSVQIEDTCNGRQWVYRKPHCRTAESRIFRDSRYDKDADEELLGNIRKIASSYFIWLEELV